MACCSGVSDLPSRSLVARTLCGVTVDPDLTDLRELLEGLTPEQIQQAVDGMPQSVVGDVLAAMEQEPLVKPWGPMEQAQLLDPMYRVRDHLSYLSDRLRQAVGKVEQGESQYIVVSMPPRAGKSQMTSIYLALWILSMHPSWPIGLISHDPSLATLWGRAIRAMVEERGKELGISLAKDAGAAGEWQTTEKGGVLSRSHGQSITGRGFKVLICDDLVKDFADAHSQVKRDALWEWWTANAITRQNGPWLVVFIGTRWHEDDILGRLVSPEYDGDPDMWEVIKFPAIAEDHDVLGRQPGEPLISPLLEETPEQALVRWQGVKKAVGSYNWSALYQQSPSPSKGMIFDVDWWRFWTINPASASRLEDGELDPNGKVVLLNPTEDLRSARWSDSWDMAFKDTRSSDYVVGQRWAQVGVRRYLMLQERGRMSFPVTLKRVKLWGDPAGAIAYNPFVYERFVEDKANGTAVIATLREEIMGLIPVNPTESKEARARAITPEAEAGHVFLPYPGDPGNEWVADLLSELREFPNGAHDDQVDALTQYLNKVRQPVGGSVSNPNKMGQRATRSRGQAAQTYRRGTGKRR